MKQLVSRSKKLDNFDGIKKFNLPPYVDVPEFKDLDFTKLVDSNGEFIRPVYAYNPEYRNVEFLRYLSKKPSFDDFSKDELKFWLRLDFEECDQKFNYYLKKQLLKLKLLKPKSFSEKLIRFFSMNDSSVEKYSNINEDEIDVLFNNVG